MVDVDNHPPLIRELSLAAIRNNYTLILCWRFLSLLFILSFNYIFIYSIIICSLVSQEECAKYIETFHSLRNKAPDIIKEKINQDDLSIVMPFF